MRYSNSQWWKYAHINFLVISILSLLFGLIKFGMLCEFNAHSTMDIYQIHSKFRTCFIYFFCIKVRGIKLHRTFACNNDFEWCTKRNHISTKSLRRKKWVPISCKWLMENANLLCCWLLVLCTTIVYLNSLKSATTV